jgi:hypothetical protein
MDRVDLKVQKFDKAISEKGLNVLWEEAMLCSCLGQGKGQPLFNCKYCNGSGYLYSPPKKIIALVTKLGGDQNFEPIGNRNVGDAYLTPTSDVLMGFHDRLTFSDLRSKYSEVVSVKFGKSVKLKHQVKSILVAQYEDLKIDIDKIEIINDGWNIKIDPDIINTYVNDEKKKAGNDFFLAMLYKTSPIYSVIDIPHELRGTQVGNSNNFTELSKQYLIKREDYTYAQIATQT